MASHAHAHSKVVFVGNVPYDMTEEQLIEVFRTVGPVVGFRLVFDRDTGKPKGFGFCEFLDHETASSAVRNLNNYEVGGRMLRVDLAESDPSVEGRTTTQGELRDGPAPGLGPDRATRWGEDKNVAKPNDTNNFMANLPAGVPVPPGSTSLDVISQTLATMPQGQVMSILSQMKSYATNYPDRCRALLSAHPQLSYAIFQAMLMNKVVDPAILQRMLARTTQTAQGPSGPPAPAPPPPMPAPPMMPAHMPAPMPPPQMMYHQQPPPFYGMQQPPPPPPPGSNQLMEDQKAMLLQVLSLSQEQINALPPTERSAIMQLRSQFGAI